MTVSVLMLTQMSYRRTLLIGHQRREQQQLIWKFSITLFRKSRWTYSTSSRALTVSIMQMTVVNSLQTGLAYLAGMGAYRSIGIVPVADRSPIGANLAYRTTFSASLALFTCGTMIACAPPSNARDIQSEVLAGTLTIGVKLRHQSR